MRSRSLSLALAAAVGLTLVAFDASAGPFDRMKRGKKDEAAFSQADVDAAAAAGDTERLRGYCQDARKMNDAWRAACDAMVADAEARGEADFLLRVCKGKEKGYHTRVWPPACEAGRRLEQSGYRKDLADCGAVTAVYDRYKGSLKGAEQDELFYAVGLKAAECGVWDYVWSDLVHSGGMDDGRGLVLLRKIAAAGHAVEPELMRYLAAHKDDPFGYEAGPYATNHALLWLIEAGQVGACDRFLGYAKKANDKNLGQWLEFFAKTDCRAAAPLAVGRLTDPDPHRRRQACAVLGRLGTKKDVKKLEALAQRDPEFRLDEVSPGTVVKTYWVREACNAAVGQITLRN